MSLFWFVFTFLLVVAIGFVIAMAVGFSRRKTETDSTNDPSSLSSDVAARKTKPPRYVSLPTLAQPVPAPVEPAPAPFIEWGAMFGPDLNPLVPSQESQAQASTLADSQFVKVNLLKEMRPALEQSCPALAVIETKESEFKDIDACPNEKKETSLDAIMSDVILDTKSAMHDTIEIDAKGITHVRLAYTKDDDKQATMQDAKQDNASDPGVTIQVSSPALSSPSICSFSSDVMNAPRISSNVVVNEPGSPGSGLGDNALIMPSLPRTQWKVSQPAHIVWLTAPSAWTAFENRLTEYCKTHSTIVMEHESLETLNTLMYDYLGTDDWCTKKAMPFHRLFSHDITSTTEPSMVVIRAKRKVCPIAVPRPLFECRTLGIMVFDVKSLDDALVAHVKTWHDQVQDVISNATYASSPTDWNPDAYDVTASPQQQKIHPWHWKRLGVPVQDPLVSLLNSKGGFQKDSGLRASNNVHVYLLSDGVDARHAERLNLVQQWSPNDEKPPQQQGTALAGIFGSYELEHKGVMGACPGVAIHDFSVLQNGQSNQNQSMCTDLVTLILATDKCLQHISDSVSNTSTKTQKKLITFVGLTVPLSPILSTMWSRLREHTCLLQPTDVMSYDRHNTIVSGTHLGTEHARLAAPGHNILTLAPKKEGYAYVTGQVVGAAIAGALLARAMAFSNSSVVLVDPVPKDTVSKDTVSANNGWQWLETQANKERITNPHVFDATHKLFPSVYCNE